MSDTVLVTIIGTIGAVAAAAITAYFNYRASERKETADLPIAVIILSPKNGEQMPLFVGEKRPIMRPISGKVTGFSPAEIETLGLVVEILISNGQWQEQGTAVVRSDGWWALENGRFNATSPRIRATIRDKDYVAYATSDIRVTVLFS